MSPRVVALVGTTASGKSSLAHEVALECGTAEIAAVDSMTVYRGLEIGTAKPTWSERRQVRYHLLDLVRADEEFTVAQFQDEAARVEADAMARDQDLLLVGGTGLYGRAVIDRLEIPGRYPEIRDELERRALTELPALYAELLERDPRAAQRIDPSNARRVVRALEVTLGSGRRFSEHGEGLESYHDSAVTQIGLRVPDDELDRRIDRRFHEWMDRGLLAEVASLIHGRGLSRTAAQAAGYKQLASHLRGENSLTQSVEAAVAATRRLARRQRRWFLRDSRIEWFDRPREARRRVLELLRTRSVGD